MLDNASEQLDLVECLRAMYPLPSELEWSEDSMTLLQALESGADTSSQALLEGIIRLQMDDDPSLTVEIALYISLQSSEVSLAPRQASWMTRAEHDRLLDDFPQQSKDQGASEYVLGTLDWIKTQGSTYRRNEPVSEVSETAQAKGDNAFGRLERVWFWFPSLSSKEKRRDLMDYALEYDLTGFVLAGKPGLLCLEGQGGKVDRYMAAIKSQSWSDIPSYQKKVTERVRKPLESTDRKFHDMRDITHLVPQYGQYDHRGDMGEVRRLMEQWGVGDDFGTVVMHVRS